MENKVKIKYFYTVATFVAVICFVIFALNNRIYRGETEILLIARNQVVDEKIDSITETAKNVPLTLSFYDRLVKSGEIEDPQKNQSPDKRKNYWLNQIETERVNDSHIIKISAFDSDKDRAAELAQIYAQELSATLAGYYNIQHQLDSRIIEEPVSYFNFNRTIWPSAVKGILLGIVAGILDILLISFIPESSIGKKSVSFGKKILTYRNNNRKKTEETEYYPIDFSQKPEIKKEKKVITPEKKSAAPENLPFADDQAAELFEKTMYANGNGKEKKEEKEEEKSEDKVTQEDIFREATPEEIKERLNKLLSGKM